MTAFEVGQKIKAAYYTSVFKSGCNGWREERVEAVLEVISKGKARVIFATMEQAWSRRQNYNVEGVVAREIGKIKIISKLRDVEAVDE